MCVAMLSYLVLYSVYAAILKWKVLPIETHIIATFLYVSVVTSGYYGYQRLCLSEVTKCTIKVNRKLLILN